jgi:glycosyltransferase involved in cell wall biosynthesis
MRDIKPIIFWEGFPVCALLLKQVVNKFGNSLIIVATRPAVPFKDIDVLLGHKIIWLDKPNDIWSRKEEFKDRNFVLHTGWAHTGWLKYDKYVKATNNAKVFVVVDNRFKKNLRQLIGALYFRLTLRRYFDGAFVPGREGQRLMSFLGLKDRKIYVGNYGAFEEIFKDTLKITKRKNEFLYVGQLNKRKSVDILLSAFSLYRLNGGSWDLRIIGSGDLQDQCTGEGVIFEGFTQPHIVASKMNNSKVFLLISRDDHWGTVVCEAAACGMHLITTKTVGATIDLVRDNINGLVLETIKPHSLANAFYYYEQLDEDTLLNGSEVSKGIARGYDSNAYYAAVNKMIYDHL